jgi:catechol 2,3-dioxygenase-like lactoylglutathione lyase family enzyme
MNSGTVPPFVACATAYGEASSTRKRAPSVSAAVLDGMGWFRRTLRAFPSLGPDKRGKYEAPWRFSEHRDRLLVEVVNMLDRASAHATIAVSDLDRAKRFYGETLGLPVKDERADGVTYEAADTWFLVYPSQCAGTAQSTCMTVEVDGDLETAVKELRDRGVTFEDYDLPGLKTENGIAEIAGVKGAWFKDPDGNILAVGERT